MTQWYPLALAEALDGGLDIPAQGISLAALSAAATFDPADEFLDDINADQLGAAVAFTGVTITAGQLTADMPAALTVADTDEVRAYAVFVDTGTAGTSRLLIWIDRAADTTLVDVVGNGGIVNVSFPGGLIGSI